MNLVMRPPRRPHWLLCFFLGQTLLIAAAPEIGAVWDGPPAELGKPLGRIQAGERTLYRWPTLEITVVDGKISRLKRLDAEGQAAELTERNRLAAEERAKWVAERRLALRSEESRKAREREAALAPSPAALTASTIPVVPTETTPDQTMTLVSTAVAESPPEPAPAPPAAIPPVVPSEPGITLQPTPSSAPPAAQSIPNADVSPPPQPDITPDAVPPPSAAPAQVPTGKGLSIVRIPSDPIAQLERSIVFLKLELARTDPKDHRSQARLLQLEIKTKEAELETMRRNQNAVPADPK